MSLCNDWQLLTNPIECTSIGSTMAESVGKILAQEEFATYQMARQPHGRRLMTYKKIPTFNHGKRHDAGLKLLLEDESIFWSDAI